MWKYCGFSIFFIWYIRNWDFNNCENIMITISIVTFFKNIYFHLHQYLKGKKKKKNFRHCGYSASWINKGVEQRGKKKKKKGLTKSKHCCSYSVAQCQHSRCTVPKYCSGTLTFIIKHLFSVVVGYRLIFYYFILTCKKFTCQ